jgi:hypothetical protein
MDNECVNGWIDGKMDGWVDGQRKEYGWVDGSKVTVHQQVYTRFLFG